MNIFCMKTCNLCEPEDGPTMPPVSCEDTNLACYAMKVYCQGYNAQLYKDPTDEDIKMAEDAKKNMEKLCPKTCNLCE